MNKIKKILLWLLNADIVTFEGKTYIRKEVTVGFFRLGRTETLLFKIKKPLKATYNGDI
ncbi:MAG: hypothetical protein ACE3L7_32975 [Candidatus Pristimantibacillus sp.]